MKKERILPLWTKLVLGAMLLVTLISAAALLFCDLQFRRSAAHGNLPSFNGFTYCAVPDGRFGQGLPQGTLLIVLPQEDYPVGSTLLTQCRDTDSPHRIAGNFCLIQLTELSEQEYRGVYADGGSVEVQGDPGDILGGIYATVPVLGGIYELMIGGPGYLLFLLLPVAASAIWALVLVNLWSKRKKLPVAAKSEEASPPSGTPVIPAPEVITSSVQVPRRDKISSPGQARHSTGEAFDVFEEPAELGYLRQSLGGAQPAPAGSEAKSTPSIIESQADDGLPKVQDLAVSKAPDAITPPEEISFPSPPSEAEEAVVIYTGKEQSYEKFAPPYLHRNFSDSLEQLRTSLKQAASLVPRVEIIMGEQAPDLAEDYRRRLREINSFDPDKIIAEIKQKNALYQQALLGETPPSKPVKPISRPQKVYHAHLCSAVPEAKRFISLEEVSRIHQQDFDEQRFCPSYITVIETGGTQKH